MNTTHNRASNEDLLCCRVCLMTDCRLFNILQYELSEAFSHISGTDVYTDQLPQYLCTYCSTLLLKCTSFRDMCLQTEQCLKLELLKGQLTSDSIRKIDRPSQRLNLALTVVQIVDCIKTTPTDIKNEPNDIIDIDDPTIDTGTKSEVNIDTDEGNLDESDVDNLGKLNIDRDESNLGESNIVEANEDTLDIECGIRNADTETENLDKDDKVKTKDHHDGVVNKDKTDKSDKAYKRNITATVREMNIEIQGDKIDKNGAETDLDVASIDEKKKNLTYTDLDYPNINENGVYESNINVIGEVEAHMAIVDIDSIIKKAVKKRKRYTRKIGTKTKSKNNCDNADTLEKAEGQVKKARREEESNCMFRSPANDNLPVFDFAKFESEYAVRIVTLSKQEQLEEIALRKQSSNYTASQFRCEECGKGFEMEAAYNNHRRRHSSSSGEHACEICSMRFKKRCLRRQHLNMHLLKFVCKECGFVTRSRSGAKTHHEVHKGRSYECQYCGRSFIKHSSCLSHVRLLHPAMNVVCGNCGETFVSEKGLKMHKAKMHSENMFKCTTCSASFVNLDALKRHTDTGEHSGKPCKQCGESCASEEALQAHVGEKHPTETHRCEECRASFSSAAAFGIHVRRKHLNQRYRAAGRGSRRCKSRKPARAPRRGQFVCEQCGHIASNTALLRYHQNNHLAVKPFPCSQCSKTFPSKAAKNAHERCHKGEKPFKCPECPLGFTNQANFKRHHKVVHLGVHDRATCHACGHVFTAKASLVVHINKVHNGQPWPKRDRKRKKVASQ